VPESCPLCRAERISRWYYESELCWIADCQICSTPMVVWRSHGMPDEPTRQAMRDELARVAAKEYPEGWWFDPVMRQIPDHFHCHARPKNGFFGPRKSSQPTT